MIASKLLISKGNYITEFHFEYQTSFPSDTDLVVFFSPQK